MNALPERLYSPDQVRELDRRTIEGHGIPGYTLMTRAGEFTYRAIRERWGAMRLTVFCGAGNNAGDGYVIARLALESGAGAEVLHLVDPDKLVGDAARAAADFSASGGTHRTFEPGMEIGDTVVVDALLGTGIDREVSGRFAEAVNAINAAECPVCAVDVPSGLSADTGQVLGVAVKADMTASFVGMKAGLLTGSGPACCGTVLYDSLGAPDDVFEGMPVKARRITGAELPTLLPHRPGDAHKGLYGHVLIIGGGPGMPGAARMAGEAALRAGAGLVSIATRPEHIAAIVAGRPELMCKGVETAADLAPMLERATIVALGPGLGQSHWSRSLHEMAMASDLPLVVDADGLNLLAEAPAARGNWILTPHPGEASRLLRQDTASIQSDRFSAVTGLAERYLAVAVLKGAGSLVAAPGEGIALCDAGNPGMAVAGMGDVLTGLIAGIAAQIDDLYAAARLAVLVHGLAGDDASAAGERGMLASDLFTAVRSRINPRC
ncbi:MAG: NAD(P)H-hydrate dehydratase [Gammaproteobacteria bacterium]|nr:MAG: NAD(P)H-hydrate dehydratase [Gammaproteobacteria bacterium]